MAPVQKTMTNNDKMIERRKRKKLSKSEVKLKSKS